MLSRFLTIDCCRQLCRLGGQAALMVVFSVGLARAENAVVPNHSFVHAAEEPGASVDCVAGDGCAPTDLSSRSMSDTAIASNSSACQSCVAASAQTIVVKDCLEKESISVLPRDEVWLVSLRQTPLPTRCCGSCPVATSHEFSAEVLVGGQWQPDGLLALADRHQTNAGMQTMLMVHGNNTDRRWAITRGMQFYDRLIGKATDCRPSVRLIILHWDSKKVLLRPLPDYKIKSARAASLGLPIACLLDELGGPRPLLVGYSLGAQVILSSMGEMAARSSDEFSGYRMALVAPALDPNYANGELATIPCNRCIADAELFINRDDRVVRASQYVSRRQNNNATVEPTLVGLLDKGLVDGERFRMFDVTGEIRNGHSLINYLQSPKLSEKMVELLRATVKDARFQPRVAAAPQTAGVVE